MAVLIVWALGGVAVWRLVVWFFSGLTRPDPWGSEVAEALAADETKPLCPHCQLPHEETDWFCPNCDSAVGQYNNLSPFLYLFSVGELLRTDTQDRFPTNWLTVSGYMALAVVEYFIFAPIYWFLLVRNILRRRGTLTKS